LIQQSNQRISQNSSDIISVGVKRLFHQVDREDILEDASFEIFDMTLKAIKVLGIIRKTVSTFDNAGPTKKEREQRTNRKAWYREFGYLLGVLALCFHGIYLNSKITQTINPNQEPVLWCFLPGENEILGGWTNSTKLKNHPSRQYIKLIVLHSQYLC
jgi:hypothetical protein